MFETLTRIHGIMKNVLIAGLLLLSIGAEAQSTERPAINLDIKTNPIGFVAGNYSVLMETPMKNPYWTLNLGAWVWANSDFGKGGGASFGMRRYFNEEMEGTFIGLYTRAFNNEFIGGVGALGFTVGNKKYLGKVIPFEYYAGLGRTTNSIEYPLDFVWGFNIGFNTLRSQKK